MASSSFADLGVSDLVVEGLADKGITEAFPIQVATIEATLSGRDICGKAPTGSGKTLAFGVPVVELADNGKPWRPRSLILAPTRELATQIKEELEPLAKLRGRTMFTVFGGTNIERDIRRLEKGIDILVACPGRLEDLISRRCCELRDVKMVVVDEADRMADMGFLPAVKRIIDQTSAERHTLLFSATLDGDVKQLIERYQNDPLRFEVEEQVGDIGDVEHSWYLIEPSNRISSAIAVLGSYQSSIVFCRTRRGCDRVAKNFTNRGLRAVAIHGDRSQGQRERALQDFATGKAHVLVATDVAARGIHVDNVSLVMHYDPPGSDKDYIHRSGRTGRAGQDGRVISMVVEDKRKIARQLQKELGMKVGFDDLDLDALPPAIDRPKHKADPAPARKKQQKSRGDSERGDRKRGPGRSRDGERNDRKRRDDGGSDRKRGGDRNRRDEGGSDRKRGGDRNRRDEGGSDRKRGGDRNRRDEGGRDSNRRRRPGPKRTNDWYPPGYQDKYDKYDKRDKDGDDDRRGGKKRPSRSRDDDKRGRGRGTKSDEDKPAGGRNTTKAQESSLEGSPRRQDRQQGQRQTPRPSHTPQPLATNPAEG